MLKLARLPARSVAAATCAFHLGNPFPAFLSQTRRGELSLLNLRRNYGATKPITICAPGFCVSTTTALSGRTSMSLYVRLPSAVARGNS